MSDSDGKRPHAAAPAAKAHDRSTQVEAATHAGSADADADAGSAPAEVDLATTKKEFIQTFYLLPTGGIPRY